MYDASGNSIDFWGAVKHLSKHLSCLKLDEPEINTISFDANDWGSHKGRPFKYPHSNSRQSHGQPQNPSSPSEF